MVINCKNIANASLISSKIKAENLKKQGILPKLSIVLVGDDEASKIYVRNKTAACKKAGIATEEIILSEDISEEKLANIVENLNKDHSVTGIIVQLPLPKHINENKIARIINPKKDVDGLSPVNMGNLILGNEDCLIPCTACAIIEILAHEKIEISSKNCVIIGRSNIVGKPTAALMLKHDATVTVCHTHTKHLKDLCKHADILISATGKPHLITADIVKKNATVIDVGISRDNDGKICGDVDFENVAPLASYITPVPGGVGPLTVAMLVRNTILSAESLSQVFSR